MSSLQAAPSRAPGTCRVSVILKAFNEEKNICAAIESALAELAEVGGEVILADSNSTDRTVALAAQYPIRIVQLLDPRQRSCGAGPQLGYQHSRGEYVHVMDGDMRMVPGFLAQALAFLEQHPGAAGVGGRVVELNDESLEYRERALRNPPPATPRQVDCLEGGGLYRRRAVEQAGYLSDRNLHAYEEFDLAVRLRALGWELWRIPVDAVTHRGHDAPPYQLLMRRWRTRYATAAGELLRGALGRPTQPLVLRGLRELRIYAGVLVWWAVLLTTPVWPLAPGTRLAAFALLAATPFALMAWRKRSLARGVYSVVSWCFNAAGLPRGLAAPRRPAGEPIPSVVVHEP